MRIYSTVQLYSITSLFNNAHLAQWLTLMPRNREAAGSNLWGFGFSLKGAYYEVGYCGKKTFLAGLQCTLTSSCAKKNETQMMIFLPH